MSLTDPQLIAFVGDALLSDASPQTDPLILGILGLDNAQLSQELSVPLPSAAGLSDWQIAAGFKGGIQDRLSSISRMCAEAARHGYILPDDPGPSINRLNSARLLLQAPGIIPDGLADDLRKLNAVVLDWQMGTVKFDRVHPAAQLASYEVSVDGIGQQSGDPLMDILGYQPDGDLVKRKRAVDALARLDFSKRRASMLFTADFVANGRRTGGTVVCWQRMRDASGYAVRKRDVFQMRDFPTSILSNDFLVGSTADLMGNGDFLQLVSFYDWLGPQDFFAFLDPTTGPDTLFRYEIAGVQAKASSTPTIFDVPTSVLHLTPGQIAGVRAAIAADAAGFSADPASISPYPALAGSIYGDPSLGWVLAGCNVLAAQRRGDTDLDIRPLMFIGSTPDTVLGALAAGRLVVPNDLAAVQGTVERALSSYGVSQAMLSVLDGIGITEYISGKDDPLGIQPTKEALDRTTGGLARILTAIDPETATVDPSVLLTNLSSKHSANIRIYGNAIVQTVGGLMNAVDGPSPLGAIGTETIDLTTFAGIGRFVTAIRIIYDYFPGMVG